MADDPTVYKFETFSRPFVKKNVRPPPALEVRKSPFAGVPGINVWGSSGDSVFNLSAKSKSEIKAPKSDDEIQRKFDVVRVKNPDDDSQYVDTEVMTEYQARNAIDKSRYTLRLDSPTKTANTEILSRGNIRKSKKA